jgi:16S rRNA (adenine1518-N6/adenine1519-N6)-dimethyltransferase
MKAKKSLGQNFLKSTSVVRAIVRAGEVSPQDRVLEIGPGKGVLTRALLETGASIIAIEKDDRLIPELAQTFEDAIVTGQLTLIHGDILTVNLHGLVGDKSYKIIANIPYYITGALFRQVLQSRTPPLSMVILVQKEVAERIVARDKKESLLSLSIKSYGKAKIVQKVKREMFRPVPNVDSAVLLISDISKSFFEGFSEEKFFTWIKAGFAQKRKKLIRNLETVASREELEKTFDRLPLDHNTRAEDLNLSDWKKLLL